MNDKLSLTELQLIIRDSLYAALPGMLWVTAEISDIRENYAGHCYLELVEKHPDEIDVRAKAKGIIWSNRLRFIKPLFESVTGQTLKSGLKILIHAKIEYHEIYGLSLIINDIDPAFTVGEMALKRQQIIKNLEDEGVISMNKELDFPFIPQRIAIISSEGAAGYTDFIKHLKDNRYGYGFYTFLFEAVMQGTETENSIIEAFDRISEHPDRFDVVVIVRGGGSQSDLSWFDNYRIAYYITQFPIPVITGIGHEKDLSVTDIVAYMSEKTPTAVADFLVNAMFNAENHILQLSSEISSLVLEIVADYKERLNNSRMRLVPVARISVSSERQRLAENIINLLSTGKDYLSGEMAILTDHIYKLRSGARSSMLINNSRLEVYSSGLKSKTVKEITGRKNIIDNYSSTLGLLNPFNVLKRGYSITSINGRIITSARMADTGDIIDTQFTDGKVSSRVTGKEITSKESK